MYPKKQSFLVLGLSRSGMASSKFLLKRGAQVFVYDDVDSEKIRLQREELVSLGAKCVKKEELSKMIEVCDALLLSPGIPIDHPLAVAFKRGKKAVIGETELAARFYRGSALAVTGTNGKTTTVSMLEKIFIEAGLNAVACGNIGTPFVEVVDEETEKIAVAEISSFQLETLNSFCPHVAVVLNITEDHLNRHYNMENYVFLKRKLLKNLTEAEFAVLNFDDETVRSFAEATKAKVVWFSMKERVSGVYLSGEDVYFHDEKILSIRDLWVDGVHNVQNVLACVAAAKLFGVNAQTIAGALASFKGVRHRIETVATVDGITYIDDSKGTNVDATLKAVACMKEETLLLLGGKDKGYDYRKLFDGLKSSKVVCAVLYGENRYRLSDAARVSGFGKTVVCMTFEHAVKIAQLLALRGQTILLSPASASFDEFSSYEERGDRFAAMVTAMQAERLEETPPTEDVVEEENVAESEPDYSAFDARTEEAE